MRDKKKWGVIILIFAIMTSIALIENFKGLFVPFFKVDLNMNDTGIGVINGLGTWAYLIFSLVGSVLCEKFGQKKVFILGISVMMVSLVIFKFVDSRASLYFGMFVFNSALALISIAINTIVPILAVGFQAVLMNLTHLFYGFGASSAQVIGSKLLANNIQWRNIYLYSSLIFVVLMIFLFRADIPKTEKVHKKNKKGFSPNEIRIIAFISIAIGFYVFAELETGSWFVNYLRNNYSFSIEKSANYIALFYIMLTIGRLVGGFIVEKIGYLKSIIIFMSIAVVLYFAGITLGNGFVILVSISGFFFSIVYPTVIVIISNLFKEKSASAIGIVVTASSLVKMLLSFGFGKLNDVIGSYNAFYFIPLGLVVSLIFINIVNKTSYLIRENGYD